jgi:ATP-dependent protease ClpP protease subunit
MAGIIAVAGHRRIITENSVWMAHDIHAGVIDYGTKIKARTEEYMREQGQAFNFLRENTKLTEKDLELARHEELWLTPKQCIEKGVVDQVFYTERVVK